MKIAVQAVLWVLIVFFSYKIYDSINGPINFNKTKNERYAQVIDRLKDIRKAQIAHKDVKGFLPIISIAWWLLLIQVSSL